MSVSLATVVLTAVLVCVTAYYAWQNQRMVHEMRRSRELSVLPNLSVDLRPLQRSTAVVVTVTNVGQGPAIGVEAVLTFLSSDPEANPTAQRFWRAGVLAPGETKSFVPPHDGERILRFEELAVRYRSVQLGGSMKDSLGSRQVVADEVDNIGTLWEMTRTAGLLLPFDDPVEKELKEIRKLAKREAEFWRRRAQPALAVEQDGPPLTLQEEADD